MSVFEVLFEDNHLLVVDKPAGLLVQGGDRSTHDAHDHLVAHAQAYLRAKYNKPGNVYVGLVHRLDRNTSGLVVLAKTSKAAERLSKAFAGRDVDKRYLAVVDGAAPTGPLEHWLAPTADGGSRVASPTTADAKRARCAVTTLAATPSASAIEVALETGRKHQIRVQLAAAGHALLGDRRYAPPAVAARFTRPALHAWTIVFVHPVRGDELRIRAPLPHDLTELLTRLELSVPAQPKIDE